MWCETAQWRRTRTKLLISVFLWCSLSSNLLFIVFHCTTSEMGSSEGHGIIRSQHHSYHCSPCLEKASFSMAEGNGAHWSHCMFHTFLPLSTVLSWHFMTAGSRQWTLHTYFDLSPYYWAALIFPLEPNTSCSALLQGTLEILLSSAPSSLVLKSPNEI